MNLLRLTLQDLRIDWRLWLGAAVVLVSTQCAITLCAVILGATSQIAPSRQGEVRLETLTSMAGFNVFLVSMVGISVVATTIGLVVAQRRRGLALRQLVGLTPAETFSTLVAQVAAVAVICAAAGTILGAFAATWVRGWLITEQMVRPGELSFQMSSLLWPWATLVGVAVVAACRPALTASRIRPLEALRETPTTPAHAMTRTRWAGGLTSVAALVALVVLATSHLSPGRVAGASMFVLIGLATTAVIFAPALTIATLRAWTAVVPRCVAPTWSLARASAIHRSGRTTAASVPVILLISLGPGLMLVSQSLRLSSLRSTGTAQASGATLTQLLMIVGLASTLAAIGAATTLFMASQQRDQEVALLALAGATPAQQVAQVVLEALMVAMSGIFLAITCLLATAGFLALGLSTFYDHVVISTPFTLWALLSTFVVALDIAANALPTLLIQRRPPQRILT